MAIFAPLLAPYDPEMGLLGEPGEVRRSAPCIHLFGCPEEQPQHIMGLDSNARDVFSRIVYGSRVSLTIGLTTVTAAVLVGAVLGAMAGFWGGWLDNSVMRVMDVVLGFPALLLAIAIVAVLGPGLTNALLAIAIVSIPAIRPCDARLGPPDQGARLRGGLEGAGGVEQPDPAHQSRSRTRSLRLVVLGTLGIAAAILEAAGLSFLGLGAQPPTPEWGTMLGEERNQVFSAPHLVFFPGLAIMLTVLGFNLLGDGLRDALDPRLNE